MQTVKFARTRALRWSRGPKPAIMTHAVQDPAKSAGGKLKNPNQWVCRAGVVTSAV